MNDLRKEIERQFKAHGLLDDETENQTIDNSPQQYPYDEPQFSEPSEEITVEHTVIAPASYHEQFASDFKNLPPEWQIFLSEHEQQNDKKYQQLLSHLQDYMSLESLYEANRLRLQEEGFLKIQDWLAGLAWVDEQLATRPHETIRALAAIYGVKLGGESAKQNNVPAETVMRLSNLERDFHELTSYLSELQHQRLADILYMFSRQTDAQGNLLHPYFDTVKDQIWGLLSSGAVQNVEDAYENALWLHPAVRAELIEKQISSKAAEAQKAQKAAFAPKGKSEAPSRPLTLREEIEKNMAAFMG